LKFKPIRTSGKTMRVFGVIRGNDEVGKKGTGLTPNILARFAICLSLKDKTIPNPEEYNFEGQEIAPRVLFGEHEQIYQALMINRLRKDGYTVTEDLLNEMTRVHLNRGAIALEPRIKDLSSFAELAKEESND
tara:strand:- start:27 stop:425 length:399 start_codon:yes stop_codon:yes gene_type:complete